MIISVDKLRECLPSLNMSDGEVRARLESLESLIRKYTNNNFQARNIRTTGNIRNGELSFLNTAHFKYGDTFQISNSLYNDGVYVYGEAQEFEDEENVLITKVVYPRDVVMGVVNLFKWDAENRDKVGVKSESLSRYSVTYYDISSNAEVGFPNGLVAFLKPYMRAKF